MSGPKRERYAVLDRDGTIIVERHYLSEPDGVELAPGAAAGLRHLIGMGLGLVVVTNQSGIGRGYFNADTVGLVNDRMAELLDTEGVRLDRIYFCPHTPDDGCACRKPQTALLELAGREMGFDPTSCFVIGDNASDIELGQNVGATTFLVSTGYGGQVSREGVANPDYTVNDLVDAARVIQGLLQPVPGV